MTNEIVTIPARGGKAVSIRQGQAVKVVNTHGEQVVDTWAFKAGDLSEFMSMDATRATLKKLIAGVGDSYLFEPTKAHTDGRGRHISAGIHDTLMAACDNERYGLLGCTDYHDNCADNLRSGMQGVGCGTCLGAFAAESFYEYSLDTRRRAVV